MWSRFSKVPPFILATFLTVGFATIWCAVIGISLTSIVEALFGRGLYQYAQVSTIGIIVSTVHYRPDGAVNSYQFADGRPLKNDEVAAWKSEDWLSPAFLPLAHDENRKVAALGWNQRVLHFVISPRNQLRWYLVHDGLADGHAHFVGYEIGTNRLLGYAGKNGFSQLPPSLEQQFAIDARYLQLPMYRGFLVSDTTSGHEDVSARTFDRAHLPVGSVYMVSDGQIWHVDLRRQTVESLAQLSDAFSLDLAPMRKLTSEQPDAPPEKLLIRTTSEIVKADLNGDAEGRWKLPEELRDKSLSIYDLGEGRILVSYLGRAIGRNLEHEFLWLSDRGEIERRQTVELLQGGLEPHEVWTMSPSLPMPSVLTLLFSLTASEVRGPDYPSKFAKALAMFWPALTLVYTVSAALAWLAYRRQMRYALPGAGIWAAFVFLLGLPGWLAYRWHRRWPVLEPCAACQRPAPRDRDTCAACGQLFPPPALVGTEVFG